MSSEDVTKFSSTANIVEKNTNSYKISLEEHSSTDKHASEKNDYDPYEHRQVKHPLSDGRSMANLIKCSLGSGILAMPAAFKNSGIVVGVIGTIIIGYICTHTVHILVRVSHETCKILREPSLGYAETFAAVFATGPKPIRKMSSFVKTFTDWAMAFTYLGACSVYAVLLMEQLKDVLVVYYPALDVATPYYSLVFLVPFLFLVQIKNLKYLAPFSALANAFMLVVFAICLYYIFADFDSYKQNDLKMKNDIYRFPSFLTTVIFAMEGIGVVMPTENQMKKPQHFLGCPGVLNISMIFIVVMYTVLGLFGYMKYGDNVLGSITLNLPHDALPAILGKVFIVVAIFFTYVLQFYVPMEVIWRNVKKSISPERHTLWQILIRIMCLLFTFAVGSLLPKLEQIIGLVGAVFYSVLGLIIPAIAETIFEWERDLGRFKWRLWKNIVILIIGGTSLIFGSIQSIRDMILS